jgi:hypothetical protein
VNADKVLWARLPRWHRRQELLDAGRLGEGRLSRRLARSNGSGAGVGGVLGQQFSFWLGARPF